MAKESFMLVSLREDKAKKLAQVMSNPTCTKILDYLSGKDATESQIAQELSIPLSTVHYNLQQLVDAKLVVVDEFHYSEKGREVNHYKLANKYIIIAPKDDEGFLQHLRKYLPAVTIVAVAGIALKLIQALSSLPHPEAMPMAADVMMKAAAPEDAMFATTLAAEPSIPWWQSSSVDYFIAGALFVLLIILIVEGIHYLRNRK